MIKKFNLSKFKVAQEMGDNSSPDVGTDDLDLDLDDLDLDLNLDSDLSDSEQYNLSTLIESLDNDPEGTMNKLRNMISDSQVVPVDGEQVDGLELLDPSRWQSLSSEEEKGKIAGIIMGMLPDKFKKKEENVYDPTIEVSAVPKNIEIASQVDKSMLEIKKMAESVAKPKKFNLSKTAQRVAQHSILFGPDSTVPLPTVNQAINIGEIIERNKGWGKKIADWWGVDYEMFWRQNVMDKYYRPYKDKDGNWVGGYLEKRFETDRNIPEMNNLQLKPGERAKPRPKELGLIEARMEVAREKGTLQSLEKKTASFNLKKKL